MDASASSAADPPALRLRTDHGPVPLGFYREGGAIFLVARERTAQWPVDVLRHGSAELITPEGAAGGPATLIVEPDERTRVLERFRAKYGDERFRRWYDHPARVVRIDLERSSTPDASVQYDRWIESEFDNVADDYDRHITGNRMNRLLRDRSLRQLRSVFAGRRRILEVGCGSGMETLPLLQEGKEVVAVDISSRMLAVVRAKAAAAGVSERLTTIKARAAALVDEPEISGTGGFDGGYSTYGALNCEPRLGPVADGFSRHLRAGAPLLLGVYNRWCLFEVLGYTATFQFGRAVGRRASPVRVGSSRFCVDVYAYAPRDVIRAFGPGFRIVGWEGVPVLLPPSDLTSYAEKYARHFDRLAAWDAVVGRWWPFRGLGDHFLMTLVRREDGPHQAG